MQRGSVVLWRALSSLVDDLSSSVVVSSSKDCCAFNERYEEICACESCPLRWKEPNRRCFGVKLCAALNAIAPLPGGIPKSVLDNCLNNGFKALGGNCSDSFVALVAFAIASGWGRDKIQVNAE